MDLGKQLNIEKVYPYLEKFEAPSRCHLYVHIARTWHNVDNTLIPLVFNHVQRTIPKWT